MWVALIILGAVIDLAIVVGVVWAVVYLLRMLRDIRNAMVADKLSKSQDGVTQGEAEQ